MQWERARQPEQKAMRRAAILKAARSLFARLDYGEISLNGIAREAGLSKPNVYRYFSTREEIFLTIFEEEQAKFGESLLRRLHKFPGNAAPADVSRAWVDAALKHRKWLDLLPRLSTSMERNSSVEQLVQFKKAGYARFNALLDALGQAHPALAAEQWATIVQCAYSMMAGLWPLTHPGKNVLAAARHPEVNRAPWKFRPMMEQGMTALILGVAAGPDAAAGRSDVGGERRKRQPRKTADPARDRPLSSS